MPRLLWPCSCCTLKVTEQASQLFCVHLSSADHTSGSLARLAAGAPRRAATDATPAPTSDNQSDFLFGGEVAALPSLLPACSFASYSSSAAESLLACELIATCSTIE